MQQTFILQSAFAVATMMIVEQSAVHAQSLQDSPALSIVQPPSLAARILGGADAEEGAYPSMVALVQSGNSALQGRLFCGGTVVSQQWILTAAHCVHTTSNREMVPSSLRAVVGINDLVLDTPDREYEVARIIVHPDYDASQDLPPNDIALIELIDSVEVNSVTLFGGETNDYEGQLGVIAGWGATEITEDNSFVYPSALQDAVVPLVTDDQCNDPESYDGLIQTEHLCAGYVEGEIDACVGDSGGPLFLTIEGTRRQVGITSFGAGCGLPFFYGIYTDITYYISWLAQYIDVPDETLQQAEQTTLAAQEQETISEQEPENQENTPTGVIPDGVENSSDGEDSGDDEGFFAGSAGIAVLMSLLSILVYRNLANGFVQRRLFAPDSLSIKPQEAVRE